MSPTVPAFDRRYMKFVSIPADRDACWMWIGGIGRDGYGKFSIDYKNRPAHRIAYAMFRGAIPTGMQIDHLCRTRACVNPAHLEPVTNRENTIRANAARGPRTHCRRGHSRAEHGLMNTAGYLVCQLCRRENAARKRSQAAA